MAMLLTSLLLIFFTLSTPGVSLLIVCTSAYLILKCMLTPSRRLVMPTGLAIEQCPTEIAADSQTIANELKNDVFDPIFDASQTMRENVANAQWVLKMLTGEFDFNGWAAVATVAETAATASGAGDSFMYGGFQYLVDKKAGKTQKKNNKACKAGMCMGICDMIAQASTVEDPVDMTVLSFKKKPWSTSSSTHVPVECLHPRFRAFVTHAFRLM